MLPRVVPLAILLSTLVCLTACLPREGRNSDCIWPDEPLAAKTLRPSDRGYAEHLRQDVEFAQELAIEHMDAEFGPRATKPRPQQTANQVLLTCLGSLGGQIAKTHNIPPNELAPYFDRRNPVIDAAMILPFLLLYALLATLFAGWLLRRYPPHDGIATTLTMGVLSAFVFGVGGLLAGEEWSGLMENFRVGNGHLSYRLDRLPWVRHRIEFFVLCLALFCIAVLARYALARRKTYFGTVK